MRSNGSRAGIREKYKDDPMGTTISMVVVAAWLFYRAEVGQNPKVTTFYDALVYVSTNMSVGYSDIFAKTPAGKAIGTFLMTFGPAMTAGMFDDKAKEEAREDKRDEDAQAVVDRLDRILAVLEARSAAAATYLVAAAAEEAEQEEEHVDEVEVERERADERHVRVDLAAREELP